jgi:hypothetical protein
VKAASARRAAKNCQENIEKNATKNTAGTGTMKAINTITKDRARAAAVVVTDIKVITK